MNKEEQAIKTIVQGSGMTANEYQKLALRTVSEDSMDDLILNGVLGLGGESGECEDLVKKYLFQGHDLDKERLAKELGDVAWYLAITARGIGYTLEDILRMNLEKRQARYPNGFDPERSLHREPGDI